MLEAEQYYAANPKQGVVYHSIVDWRRKNPNAEIPFGAHTRPDGSYFVPDLTYNHLSSLGSKQNQSGVQSPSAKTAQSNPVVESVKEQKSAAALPTASASQPSPAQPKKPQFSMRRAETFEGTGGYVYAYDPVTKVIAIVKGKGGVLKEKPVYVRPDGNHAEAYKQIMAERLGAQAPVWKEDDVTVSVPAATQPTPKEPTQDQPETAKRRKSLFGFVERLRNADTSPDEMEV